MFFKFEHLTFSNLANWWSLPIGSISKPLKLTHNVCVSEWVRAMWYNEHMLSLHIKNEKSAFYMRTTVIYFYGIVYKDRFPVCCLIFMLLLLFLFSYSISLAHSLSQWISRKIILIWYCLVKWFCKMKSNPAAQRGSGF